MLPRRPPPHSHRGAGQLQGPRGVSLATISYRGRHPGRQPRLRGWQGGARGHRREHRAADSPRHHHVRPAFVSALKRTSTIRTQRVVAAPTGGTRSSREHSSEVGSCPWRSRRCSRAETPPGPRGRQTPVPRQLDLARMGGRHAGGGLRESGEPCVRGRGTRRVAGRVIAGRDVGRRPALQAREGLRRASRGARAIPLCGA